MATIFMLAILLLAFSQSMQANAGSPVLFNITCDPLIERSCQSMSLEMIAANVNGHKNSDVQISVNTQYLQLNSRVNFTHLNSLSIDGTTKRLTNHDLLVSTPAIITCTTGMDQNGAGISIESISDRLVLKNINLTLCGVRIIKNRMLFVSALTIFRCGNVLLNRVTIEKSTGIGLMILNHTGGGVNITFTVFKDNTLSQEHNTNNDADLEPAEKLRGGGGVYIELSQNSSGLQVPIIFVFNNCLFKNNTSNISTYKLSYTEFEQDEGVWTNHGNGGGCYIAVLSNMVSVQIQFISCEFIGNQAFLGSGLSVNYKPHDSSDRVRNNVSIKIENSQFTSNGCNKSSVFGGALYIYFNFMFERSTSIANYHFTARNVSFLQNYAKFGGSVTGYFKGRLPFEDCLNPVMFDNCTFVQNQAHMGSAIYLTPSVFLWGYTFTPQFKNCLFLNNSVFSEHSRSPQTQTIPGIGTIYTRLQKINFHGFNQFRNNFGSAVYVVNGVVNFQNSGSQFHNNTGLRGGAVALGGRSKLVLGQKNYEFVNNRAVFYGGAIYVSLIDFSDFSASKDCFIEYVDENTDNEWRANITFTGNTAKDSMSGHALYATSLHPCLFVNDGTNGKSQYRTLNVSEVFTVRNIKFDKDSAYQPQVATDGAYLNSQKSSPLKIVPGECYEHGIVTRDDLGQTVNSLLQVDIKNNADNNVQLDHIFSTGLIGNNLQLRGMTNETATLHFVTISNRQAFIDVRVILQRCPPGFKDSGGTSSKCVCNTHNHVGLLKCDLSIFQSYLMPGYWAGLIDSNLVTGVCPLCRHTSIMLKSEVILPRSYSDLDAAICGETRTGILCGKCRENYIVHFHSPGYLCKPVEPLGCKLGWLFYILSELLPLTVFFAVVLVLNISFTSGAVNGFILFSQLINSLDIYAGGIVTFNSNQIKTAIEGYQVIYGHFNLDFFNIESLSFCIWKHASVLDIIASKYITIVYSSLLIVLVIWTINKCGGRCLGRYCRITTIKTSAIHGISTFLVIGYAQCVNISLKLLVRVFTYKEQNSDANINPRLWFNGEIVYFSKEHLPYALPALFCLLTICLLPPLLLLTYPLLNKGFAYFGLEDKALIKIFCRIIHIDSLKPLFDCFQGCFKDSYRFFGGLYFLYRCTFLIIYSYSAFTTYYTCIIIVLSFILILHTICQPYIRRLHNCIDALLFFNLILICSLSLFNYHVHRNSKPQWRNVPVKVQLLLIYLPILVMVIYLAHILFKTIRKYRCFRNASRKVATLFKLISHKRANKLRKVFHTLEENTDSMSGEEEFIHNRLMDEDDDEDVYFRRHCAYILHRQESRKVLSSSS